jgi:hypothetical protein
VGCHIYDCFSALEIDGYFVHAGYPGQGFLYVIPATLTSHAGNGIGMCHSDHLLVQHKGRGLLSVVRYTILEKTCIILDLIEWLSVNGPLFFEVTRAESGYFFELIAQIGSTGIMQLKGNLTERFLIVYQQFFHLLDLLVNDVFFNGYPFHFGE